MNSKKTAVLLSGGLDSATTLAIAKRDGYRLVAITFRYGQRHELEVRAAKKVAESLGVEKHLFFDLDLGKLGGSALLDPSQPIPKDRTAQEMAGTVPQTYVPARNLIMLAYATAVAEVEKADAIHIGVNAIDTSGYPDCCSAFLAAFSEAARLGTKRGAVEKNPIRIISPLMDFTKGEIIKLGTGLGVDYGLTWSCYDPTRSGQPCGRCDSCRLRAKGFAEAGLPDPLKGPP